MLFYVKGNIMNQFIWLDGAITPAEKAMIPVTTHTLHYGSGAFEGIRCYTTKKGLIIFRLSEHIERLLTSFSLFEVAIPWTKKELEQAVVDTVQANSLKNCYLRPILFFGSESLLLNPSKLSVHCAIIAFDMEKYLGKKPITVGISKVKRISPDAMPVHNKINGFYVNSIFALNEVKDRGFDEALLLDHEGNVAEGSVANIFFVIDGILKTSPAHSILPGITRDSVLKIARKLDIPIQESLLTKHDIGNATEAFFTGTASEITPIKTIEEKQFNGAPGAITQKIIHTYQNTTLGNDNSFKPWLTFINQ